MNNQSNLPPGVSDAMIPGNRPEDVEWDEFHAMLDNDIFDHDLTIDNVKAIWQDGLARYLETRHDD